MTRILDVFSGMGGLALGFLLALSDATITGIDINRGAVDTFNLNLERLGGRAFLGDALKWEPGESYDAVIAGVPCQPFSQANIWKRGEKHELYPTFARFFDIILTIKPRVFLMENVKGLLMSYRALLESQLSRVTSLYRVRYQVLNASNYGVPQSRERLIVIGFHRDLNLTPTFPAPTHAERESATLFSRIHRWVTLGEAIGDLLKIPPGSPDVPDHVQTPKGGWTEAPGWGSRVLSENKPAYTITEKHRAGQLVQTPTGTRRLTVREALRLQSFPDWWRFPKYVSISERFKHVGNAVPPILAYRLATHIAKQLGWETREPPREDEWQLPYFRRSFADYFT